MMIRLSDAELVKFLMWYFNVTYEDVQALLEEYGDNDAWK